MSSDSASKTIAEGTEIEKTGEDVENIRSGSQEVGKVGIVVESSELLARIEVQKTSVLVKKEKNYGLEDSERSDIADKVGSFSENLEDQKKSLNAEMGKEIDDVKVIKEVGKMLIKNTSSKDDKEIEENNDSTNFEIGQTLKSQDVEQSDATLETQQSNKVNEEDNKSAQNTFVMHDSSNADQNKIKETVTFEMAMGFESQLEVKDGAEADVDSVLKNDGKGNTSAVMTNQKSESAENAPNLEKDNNIVNCEKSKIPKREESVSESASADSSARQSESVAEDIKLDDTLIKYSNNVDNVVETQNSENGTNSFVCGDKNQCRGSILEPTLVESIADQTADNCAADSKSGETLTETSRDIVEDQIAESTVNGLDSAIELRPQMSENESGSSKLLVVQEIECNASIVEKQETDHDISMMDIDEDTNHDASNLQSHSAETGSVNLQQVDKSSFNSVFVDNTLNNGTVMQCNDSVDKHSSDNVNIVIGDDGSLSVVQEMNAKHEIICMNLDIEERSQVCEKDPSIESDTENEIQFVSYHLPNLEISDFSFSDLVWGKVKSHPWWPGQIFDPSDASKLASKYRKKDAFLIAYYGDKTFAWCDDSQLKPFYPHFSQLEKLCNSDTFSKGINDILIEVSRRIVLGMACSCLRVEDYSNMKYQKIENAGIRGGNIEAVLDKSNIVNYFQPDKLVEYIKTLSLFPNGKVDKLEFATAQSQLEAFYRSKGYAELPIFNFSGGEMEIETETNNEDTMTEANSPLNKIDEKQKSAANLVKDRTPPYPINSGKRKAEAKATQKLNIGSGKKRNKVAESDTVDLGTYKKITLDPVNMFEIKELKSTPPPSITSSFKIGEFIKRAASNLTGASPTAKCLGETLIKKDDIDDFGMQNQNTDLRVSEDCNSTYEMFSQLCIAATDPMNEYSFVTPIVDFYTEFRNFYVCSSISRDLESAQLEKRRRRRPRKTLSQPTVSSENCSSEDEKTASMHEILSQNATSEIGCDDGMPIAKRKRGRPKKTLQPASPDSNETKKPIARLVRSKSTKNNSQPQATNTEKRKRGRPKKVITDIVASDLSPKDLYWSDTGLVNEESSGKHQNLNQYKRKSTGHSLKLQLGTLISDIQHKFSSERSIISVDEKIVNEHVPTSLFLNFSNAKSLPSETDLIRKFSRYGPLKEAETEVLRRTNQAKIVFKRQFDADIAFSCAGKYSIFGPELLSYQLKPWTPKSILEEMPEEIHGMPIEDNRDAAEGKQETVLMVSSSEGNQESVMMASLAEENHGLAPVTRMQYDENKCDVEPTEEINVRHSEQMEAVKDSVPMEIEAETKESMPETNVDQANQVGQNVGRASSEVDMVQDMSYVRPIVESNLKSSGQVETMDLLPQNHVLVQTTEHVITTLEDQHNSASSTLQKKHDANTFEHTLDLSEQAEVSVAPDNKEVEVKCDICSSEINKDNLIPTTTKDILHATSTIALLDRSDKLEHSEHVKSDTEDVAPVVDAAAINEKSDLEIPEQVEAEKDSVPAEIDGQDESVPEVSGQGNRTGPDFTHATSEVGLHATSIDTVNVIDYVGAIAGSNSKSSEKDDSKGLLPQDLFSKNQDEEHVTSLEDQHALALTTLKDKHDAPHISEDTLKLSEQAEVLIVSDGMKVEAECNRYPVLENQNDLIATTTTRQNVHAASTIAPRDKNDNAEHSEKNDVTALDITEGNKTTIEFKIDTTLADKPVENPKKDQLIPALTNCDINEPPIITDRSDDLVATPKSMIKFDDHDAALLTNDRTDAVHIEKDDNDAVPLTIKENVAAVVTPDTNDAALAEEQVEPRAITESMKTEVKGNLLEVSEQMEPGVASETAQLEVECGNKKV